LFSKQRERGMTLVLVTHDPSLAEQCDMTLRVRAGEIEQQAEKPEKKTRGKSAA
jgi:putative ABC transport system ATP-binding protein